jgi:hypothetical protein
MTELGSYGVVSGARGNWRPYREPRSSASVGMVRVDVAAGTNLSPEPSTTPANGCLTGAHRNLKCRNGKSEAGQTAQRQVGEFSDLI